jgi:plasmid stabilization system protein ParE
MTLPNIVLSSEAHADLLDIEAYIVHQDGEARAEMVIGRLTQGIRSLAFMPGMGRTRRSGSEETLPHAAPNRTAAIGGSRASGATQLSPPSSEIQSPPLVEPKARVSPSASTASAWRQTRS